MAAWYTTKHVDHSWVSAVSETSLSQFFAESSGDGDSGWDITGGLGWDITGHPNGRPYPERASEEGSFEEVVAIGFSSDSSAAYFVDSSSVSGFSFPRFVPLFREERPELSLVSERIEVPSAAPPSIAWTSADRIAVATVEGSVGSILPGSGAGWAEDRLFPSGIASFDAIGRTGAAILCDGAIVRWNAGEEAEQVASVGPADATSSQLRLWGEDLIVATPGRLAVLGIDGCQTFEVTTPIEEVARLVLQRHPDPCVVIVGADRERASVGLDAASPEPRTAIVLPGNVAATAIDRTGTMTTAWSDGFIDRAGIKRCVYPGGTVGPCVGTDIVVLGMGRLLSDDPDSGPYVLAVDATVTDDIVAGTSDGRLVRFLMNGEEAVQARTVDGPIHDVAFDDSGEWIAATAAGVVHLFRSAL